MNGDGWLYCMSVKGNDGTSSWPITIISGSVDFESYNIPVSPNANLLTVSSIRYYNAVDAMLNITTYVSGTTGRRSLILIDSKKELPYKWNTTSSGQGCTTEPLVLNGEGFIFLFNESASDGSVGYLNYSGNIDFHLGVSFDADSHDKIYTPIMTTPYIGSLIIMYKNANNATVYAQSSDTSRNGVGFFILS